MKYLIIALFAFWWLNAFSIPIGTSPIHPVTNLERMSFAMRVAKPALPTIIVMNDILDPSTRVYGVWMEDYRFYADFQLVGSIYGYGSHLVLNKIPIVNYLGSLDCEYIMWDESRFPSTEPYFDGVAWAPPTEDPYWSECFEECTDMYAKYYWEDGTTELVCPTVRVYRLKTPPETTDK